MKITVNHDISTIRDCLEPVISNKALLRSEVTLSGNQQTTINIESDDLVALKKTKITISRYLKVLDKISRIK